MSTVGETIVRNLLVGESGGTSPIHIPTRRNRDCSGPDRPPQGRAVPATLFLSVAAAHHPYENPRSTRAGISFKQAPIGTHYRLVWSLGFDPPGCVRSEGLDRF
jgi:hypothetical protein